MPYRVRKSIKSGYDIQKKSGGKWKKIGHSSSKSKAESSVRARQAGEHGWQNKPNR